MPLTTETPVTGSIIEVSNDDGATWEKFACNEGTLKIDWGEATETEFECLETGLTKTVYGADKFEKQSFRYYWTQALTNAADTIVFNAKQAKSEIIVKTTMKNATGTETVGTNYTIPFKVSAYAHIGEKNSKWETETTFKQVGYPVPAAAE